jgi:hypothetical protein
MFVLANCFGIKEPVLFLDPLGPGNIVTGIDLDGLFAQSCQANGVISIYIDGVAVVSQSLPAVNCVCNSCEYSSISNSYYLPISNYNYNGNNSIMIVGQDICVSPFSFELLFSGMSKLQMLLSVILFIRKFKYN